MIYFRNPQTDEVHGYDDADPRQLGLIEAAIDAQWVEEENWSQAPMTQDDIRAVLDAEVTKHIDGVAQGRGYTNAAYLISYCNSTQAQWAQDAATFVPWRDAVWLACIDIQADVLAEIRAVPTAGELIAELPVIAWVDV